MWKQGMWKSFEPRNQLVCPLPHESTAGVRQTWVPSVAPSEPLPGPGDECHSLVWEFCTVEILAWSEAHSSPVLSCGPFLGEFPFPGGNTSPPKAHQDLAMLQQAFTPVTFLWRQSQLWKIRSFYFIQLKTTLTRRHLQCFNFFFR